MSTVFVTGAAGIDHDLRRWFSGGGASMLDFRRDLIPPV
jgi:hypothetical protein